MAKQMQFEPSSMAILGEKGDLLHSVQRALRVLSLIAQHPQGLSAREVSNRLCLNISPSYFLNLSCPRRLFLLRCITQLVCGKENRFART